MIIKCYTYNVKFFIIIVRSKPKRELSLFFNVKSIMELSFLHMLTNILKYPFTKLKTIIKKKQAGNQIPYTFFDNLTFKLSSGNSSRSDRSFSKCRIIFSGLFSLPASSCSQPVNNHFEQEFNWKFSIMAGLRF